MNRMLPFAALALLAVGCVQIEAEIPEVCKTQAVQVQGSAAALTTPGPVEQDVPFLPTDSMGLLTTLSLSSGQLDVSSIDPNVELSIDLVPPEGDTAPALPLLRAAGGQTTYTFANEGADLLPYLGGTLQLTLQHAPTQSVGLTLKVCVSAAAQKEFQIQP
ncbi:MAG: hypothetical protein JST92_20755 [Deltaproteobacteria bacterium]|nr:hypothetical protein [Deltaproteobacteria bacterium]